jgi:UDP-N-acetylmuramoylalanine--D-glutamate ligase
MELGGKKFLVIGLARTGAEVARFLAEGGAGVAVSDLREAAELQEPMQRLAGMAVQFLHGAEQLAWLDGIDCVIPSPGVAANNPLLREALRKKVPVLSEIELAYRFFKAPLAAITGTNGKSTTTSLLGAMMEAAGLHVFVGGNLGTPFISAVLQRWEWGVLEISSFQLEWIETFRPRIAVLLNVTEDHLDRYRDFDDYRRAKERVFEAQTHGDFAVLNREDPRIWALKDRLRARVWSFGFSECREGVFAAPGRIVWRDGGIEEVFPLSRVKLQGVHNVENMMAAIAAAKLAGIARPAVQQVLETFPGLEHRLEFVRELAGVRYYNDSKGTNVGAVAKSLAGFSAPVILLAGGVDKGGDYGPLREDIRRTVRRLILFGAAKDIIARALGDLTETVLVDNLAAAVREAATGARPGDVVLLSPACSSFDQFRNYAERGRAFRDLVAAL